jgi:hypothetical protein
MLAEECFLACNCFSMQCQVVVNSWPILRCFWQSIGACSSSLIPIWVLACPIPLVTAHLLYTKFGSAYIPRTSSWKLIITSGQIFFNIQQDPWTSKSFSSISQKNLHLFQRLITHSIQSSWIINHGGLRPSELFFCFLCCSINLATISWSTICESQRNFLITVLIPNAAHY